MPFYLVVQGPFCHWGVSHKVIRRALKKRGFRRYVSLSKPPLSPANIAKRLAFAIEHLDWTKDQWKRVLYTDETWATGYHRKYYVTRCAGEELDPTCINERVPKPKGWMFWGCFSGNIKGPCLFWEKAWGKINSSTYRQRILPVIDDWMQLSRRAGHQLILIQDGAPGHRAYATQQDIRDHGILMMDWPPFSPDLNLIETVWNKMKDYIQHQLAGERNPPLPRLRRLVTEAWEQITPEQLDAILDTMHQRCQDVIDAHGKHTKW
jgi:hypothetical protein